MSYEPEGLRQKWEGTQAGESEKAREEHERTEGVGIDSCGTVTTVTILEAKRWVTVRFKKREGVRSGVVMVEAAAGEQGNEWRGREEPASHSPGDRGWRNRSLSEGSLCRAVSMAFPGVALGPRVSGRAAEGRRAPLPGLCRRGPAALQPASAPGPAARPLGGLSTWPEACLPTPLFVALPPLSPCSAFTVHKVTLFGAFCGSPAIKYIKIICSFSLSVPPPPSDYKLLL
uniref:Uncharacterized protein n=1 Tax=Rangifer tarandus platyrhynchus TaxID=3082113 RepID=A0ACB0E5C3_RANTA|nr:unnamed protein product [Rangifer tarandus platyrhynchus]